jgi:hypothetical protein
MARESKSFEETHLTYNPYSSEEHIPKFDGYNRTHRFEKYVFHMLQAVDALDAWEAFAQTKSVDLISSITNNLKIKAVTNHPLVNGDGHSVNTMYCCISLVHHIICNGSKSYLTISAKNQSSRYLSHINKVNARGMLVSG